ncbi:MAG: hypothetical protein NUV77_01660 [Thermoguttaceae bacterium]|nr:hypothetical protein [Thermoguttaceae bacterium]
MRIDSVAFWSGPANCQTNELANPTSNSPAVANRRSSWKSVVVDNVVDDWAPGDGGDKAPRVLLRASRPRCSQAVVLPPKNCTSNRNRSVLTSSADR